MTDTDDEDGLDPGMVEDIVGPVKRVTAIFGELLVNTADFNQNIKPYTSISQKILVTRGHYNRKWSLIYVWF